MKSDLAMQIARLLVTLDEENIMPVAREAEDMAIRAKRGWWEMCGSPSFNKRMKRLRHLMEEMN